VAAALHVGCLQESWVPEQVGAVHSVVQQRQPHRPLLLLLLLVVRDSVQQLRVKARQPQLL
jgi:hypothetical protein